MKLVLRVAKKAGTPTPNTNQLFRRPKATARPKANPKAHGSAMPWTVMRLPARAALKPATAPVERSICPIISRKTMA